jgi:short-subunit dehydrogenase
VFARDLEERYRVQVRPIRRDLARPDAPAALFDECGEADFLVNNAGFGYRGRFTDAAPATVAEMPEVNVTALTQLTRLFLTGMLSAARAPTLPRSATAG